MDEVLKRVLKKIEPNVSEKKRILNAANSILKVAQEESKKENGTAMLSGSLTRDTWLLDKKEIDVFLLFSSKWSNKRLEEIGLKIGKKIVKRLQGKYMIWYAQHPYLRAKVKGYDADIVPCYKLKSAHKIKSAVDRTPFHVKYIERTLKPDEANEVRLLKQFCKAQNIYSASLKSEGFSGYLCDLLIIKFKSFKNTVINASKWKPGIFIDLEQHNKTKKAFTGQPLVFIDPVDPNRNVAAVISPKSFIKFVTASKKFIKAPSEKFFFPKKEKPITRKGLLKLIKERRTELISIVFKCPTVVPDIVWPQMRKAVERLEKILLENEFKVLNKGVWTDEKKVAVILFEMEVWKLPGVEKRIGPSIFSLKQSENFIKRYKKTASIGPFIENDRLVFEIKRKFEHADEKLKDSLTHTYKILKAKGIPSYVAESIAGEFRILKNERIVNLKNREFRIFLGNFFQEK